jgi:hypothetical protein
VEVEVVVEVEAGEVVGEVVEAVGTLHKVRKEDGTYGTYGL